MLQATYDSGIFSNVDPRFIIFVIDDHDSRSLYPNFDNVILVTDLLPTFNSLSAAIDGDMNMFNSMYVQQILGLGNEALFLVLAASFIKERNVILYCKNDLEEYCILQLIDYVTQLKYGIELAMIDTGLVTRVINDNLFFNFICEAYLQDLYNLDQFLTIAKLPQYSNAYIINQEVAMKLAYEIKPVLMNGKSANDYMAYFNEYLKTIREYKEKRVESPLIDKRL